MVAGAFICQQAVAAAGGDVDDLVEAPSAALTVPQDYALDTEMVVHNWVLCVSRAFAEELVLAHEQGPSAARRTYEGLQAGRFCGQFAELRVILQARLTAVSIDRQRDARVFEALVNLSGNWASAFVVSGGLPD
jgi:hypothetical protein